MQADPRFGFLRLITIKNGPHMLKSDHRGLRNRDLKLMWVVVGGGGWWWGVGVEGENRNKLGACQHNKTFYQILQIMFFSQSIKSGSVCNKITGFCSHGSVLVFMIGRTELVNHSNVCIEIIDINHGSIMSRELSGLS